jgi:hypothetical protein
VLKKFLFVSLVCLLPYLLAHQGRARAYGKIKVPPLVFQLPVVLLAICLGEAAGTADTGMPGRECILSTTNISMLATILYSTKYGKRKH